jgi:hypothetical protein
MVEALPWSTLTPMGLLLIIILLIALGRLVPRRTLEDAIHDRNEWRTAHGISEAARLEQSAQLGELLEHARATDRFLTALPPAIQAAAPRAYESPGEGLHDGGR